MHFLNFGSGDAIRAKALRNEMEQSATEGVGCEMVKKNNAPFLTRNVIMAGETRFEHATYGFGDRYSTVEPLP